MLQISNRSRNILQSLKIDQNYARKRVTIVKLSTDNHYNSIKYNNYENKTYLFNYEYVQDLIYYTSVYKYGN